MTERRIPGQRPAITHQNTNRRKSKRPQPSTTYIMTNTEVLSESLAARILRAALAEGRAAEAIICLMDGGSVTVDMVTGRLVCVTAEQLAATVEDG